MGEWPWIGLSCACKLCHTAQAWPRSSCGPFGVCKCSLGQAEVVSLTLLEVEAGRAFMQRCCWYRDQDSVALARADFAKWHKVDLDQGRCIVFRFPDRDKELVLVPVRIKTGTCT